MTDQMSTRHPDAPIDVTDYQAVRALFGEAIPNLDDRALEFVLTTVHEEHERRHGGHRWVRRVTL